MSTSDLFFDEVINWMKRGSQKVLDCEVNLVKYLFWGKESDQIATKAGFEKNNFLHPTLDGSLD